MLFDKPGRDALLARDWHREFTVADTYREAFHEKGCLELAPCIDEIAQSRIEGGKCHQLR
mgnify:CR=1 FL=1